MRWLVPVVLWLSALVGCAGDGGAVTVRWRLVDLNSGEEWNPAAGEILGPDGSCLRQEPVAEGSCLPLSCSSGCCKTYGWQIDTVVLIVDPETPSSTRYSFDCAARERTTPFDVPLGFHRFSLVAGERGEQGVTPPGQERKVDRGQIVNLDVIEVGVRPYCLDPLQLDMSCGDMAQSRDLAQTNDGDIS